MKEIFTLSLVYIYGVLKEFRPGTPFLTPFLENEPKNFTNTQLYSQIYPFWTYSYLFFLIPIIFLVDRVKYKPIVILEALSLTLTWVLLVFGDSVTQMQLMQVAFGLASAAEVAYFAYIYSIVEKEKYKTVTSYVRSSALSGKLVAFILAQAIVSLKLGSYLLLQQITLGAVSIATVFTLCLPNTKSKVQKTDLLLEDNNNIPHVGRGVFQELKQAFKSSAVLSWSIWWALASCGTYQVANYVQTLWAEMQVEGQFVGNGAVEVVNSLLNVLLTFFFQWIHIDWIKYSSVIFVFSSITSALLLFSMAFTTQILLSYVFYILISALYHVLIAAASHNIALESDSNKNGLIFGFNSFVALILQTILTITVTDEIGLQLSIRSQFYVYGGYFVVLAGIFIVLDLVLKKK